MTAITGGLNSTLNYSFLGVQRVDKAVSTSTGTATFTHNLGYKPPIIAYAAAVATPTIYYPLPYVGISSASGIVNIKFDIVSDNDSVNCYIITPSAGSLYTFGYSYNFYIYIAQAPLPE